MRAQASPATGPMTSAYTNLLMVLAAERAALAAMESLPVSPDGRQVRAA